MLLSTTPLRTLQLSLGLALLLSSACSKAPEQQSTPAAAAPAAAAPAPVPEPVAPTQAAALPSEPAAAPAAPDPEAQARAVPISAEERELHDFVVQLVREPGRTDGLAPNAKLVMEGSHTLNRALKDAHADLGWIASSEIELVSNQAPLEGVGFSTMQCEPAKLTCLIIQPGGDTKLSFKRQKGKLLLTRSWSSD